MTADSTISPDCQAALAWELDPLTVGAELIAATRRNPHNDALVMDGRRASYAALLDEVLLWARALHGMGVRRGDHIGILMPNCWDYIVLFHASTLLGAWACTLNARYREADLRYVIPNADVSLLVIGGQALKYSDYRALVGHAFPEIAAWDGKGPLRVEAAPMLRCLVNLDDPRELVIPGKAEFLAHAEGVTLDAIAAAARQVTAADIGILMFSSGTTANPKACMLSQENLTRTGRALAARLAMTAADRFWDPLPFFHMSTMLPLSACRAAGSTFIACAHFDAGAALETIEHERVTIIYSSFPMIMNGLIGHESFSRRDLGSVRIVENVGPADLLRRYMQALPHAVHINCYGLTEGGGVPVYSEMTDTVEQRTETSGRPFPGVDIRIVDPDTLQDVPPGAPGEILIRGFVVFSGYYKDPEKTAATILPGGWLRTSDIGSLTPEGRVIYRGRFKDMLKIGGENVAAVEIESYLLTHPAVRLVQVVGVPDDHLIEVAAAFVELHPGAVVTAEELVAFCAGKIASYKIPRYVRFVTEWPMSATKVQKFRLTEGFVPEGKLDVRGLVAG